MVAIIVPQQGQAGGTRTASFAAREQRSEWLDATGVAGRDAGPVMPDVGGPSQGVGGPSPDVGGPSPDVGGPSQGVGGPLGSANST